MDPEGNSEKVTKKGRLHMEKKNNSRERRRQQQEMWEINLVNSADLKTVTEVVKPTDCFFFDISSNCKSFSSNIAFKILLEMK